MNDNLLASVLGKSQEEIDKINRDYEMEKLKKENYKYLNRLQISPYGDDKIDELESCIGFLRHEIETLKIELDDKKKIVDLYATSARTISLWLENYCDDKLPYSEMIAEAARKVALKLEYFENKFEDMKKDIKISCETCKIKNNCDVGGKCMFQGFDYWKWRGDTI